mmetsp:Transcript_11471/g.44460  ORF Transcript_11471/g.44460 Transcript_11471/m.44460 type:complete len:221 (-) Transcript_11471:3143-3805(-)
MSLPARASSLAGTRRRSAIPRRWRPPSPALTQFGDPIRRQPPFPGWGARPPSPHRLLVPATGASRLPRRPLRGLPRPFWLCARPAAAETGQRSGPSWRGWSGSRRLPGVGSRQPALQAPPGRFAHRRRRLLETVGLARHRQPCGAWCLPTQRCLAPEPARPRGWALRPWLPSPTAGLRPLVTSWRPPSWQLPRASRSRSWPGRSCARGEPSFARRTLAQR